MAENIWNTLEKPILVLAPMADVTDAAFRQIIAKYSRPNGPHLFYTEFVSADGLMHPEGRKKLIRELHFSPIEQPIICQLFSSRPEVMREAAAFISTLGFAGIDINMGCPDKGIEKQGCGASLIKEPTLAQELILAAKEGGGGLPVSVKTRIGYNKVELETWAPALFAAKPAAVTFHLRTRKEMSKVAAHWELAHLPVELARGTGVLVLANGDVANPAEARQKALAYSLDGIMLGRAIYGNPWLFTEVIPTVREKLEVMVEHVNLYHDLFGPTETNQRLFGGHTKSFAIMKKHFKAYAAGPVLSDGEIKDGFPGAAELRVALMDAPDPAAVAVLVRDFLRREKLL